MMLIRILAGWALLATTVADLRPQEGDEPQLPDSHKEPVMMMMMMIEYNLCVSNRSLGALRAPTSSWSGGP